MDLFLGIIFFMTAVTAAGELKHSGGGVLRYIITVPPAFALGALIVWVDWKLGKAVWLRYQGYPKQAQNMLGFAWIVLDLFWIMIWSIPREQTGVFHHVVVHALRAWSVQSTTRVK